MTVSLTTVTWDVEDMALAGTSGSITFQLSQVVVDTSTGNVFTPSPPRTYSFAGVPGQSDPLVANDSASLQPQGTYYKVTVAGATASYTFNVAISHTAGATQTLGSLIADQVQPVQQMSAYLLLPTGTPEPGDVPTIVSGTQTTWAPSGTGGSGFPGSPVVSGTPAAGQVLTATSATAATWETPTGGGGNITSVFGRTGIVTAQSGDYTAAQVGADPAGSASAAQSSAESYAAAQASAAQSAAEAASLPLPSGTATAGYVAVATGTGNATTWQAQTGGGSGSGNIDGGSATTGQAPVSDIDGGNA